MNKLITLVATALLIIGAGTAKAQDNVNIGKSNIKLNSRMMTPEALWAMGRIGGVAASPNGSQVVYQVGYYSVKQNKGHQVICIMNADGSQQRQLTTSSKSETDPVWLNAETIAFNCGGEIWTMKADGSDRQQLTKTGGKVEGFKFSPDGTKVILIQSIPFHEIIKKNPDDLPLATGRRVTDLMYRHWDHYVESIQHPFLAEVTAEGVGQGIDILEGEPFECPMAPFGGIEQLAWSPDSKTIAYTCRKKEGVQYAISTDSDIYLYDVKARQTVGDVALRRNRTARYSADSQGTHTADHGFPSYFPHFPYIIAYSRGKDNLFFLPPVSPGIPPLSPDCSWIFQKSTHSRLYKRAKKCYDVSDKN